MSKQLVIYIAGPYRAEHERGVVLNIRKAEDLALEVWRRGHAPLCPHKNTALLGGACPDETWLRGDITMMLRCDAVLLVEGWERSSGTRAEVEEARSWQMPVLETLDELDKWASLQPRSAVDRPYALMTHRIAEVAEQRDALAERLAELSTYAASVMIDRRNEEGDMALQTVEWCEGLLELCGLAQQSLRGRGFAGLLQRQSGMGTPADPDDQPEVNQRPLRFVSLRSANASRAERWRKGQPPLPLSFAMMELAGEVGEACNEAKKLERAERGMAGGKVDDGALASELADVVICADLAAQRAGIDLGQAVARKFNATSEKHGFPERLGETGGAS